MNKYSVTFNLPNEKGFLDFVNRIGPLVGKFEVQMSQTVDESVAAKPTLDQSAMSAPRGKRKSKVVETILSTLRIGEAPARGAPRRAGERAWPNRPSSDRLVDPAEERGDQARLRRRPIASRSRGGSDHLARLLRQQCRP